MNLVIEITIIIVGFILFFSIKNFLPSYFNEKGKNLATKEDVEIITEKVEKIKTEFVKDIEFIKADLSYINQNKFSIKAAERDSLLDTNNKYSKWLNYLMNISFSDINPDNYKKLNEVYAEVKKNKLEFDVAQDNLHLFLHDEELMKLKLSCVTETINLEYILSKAIADIVNHFNLRNLYFSAIENLPEDKKPTQEFIKEQLASFQDDLDKIFYKMNTDKSKQFESLHKHRVFFVSALKKRLYNIMID